MNMHSKNSRHLASGFLFHEGEVTLKPLDVNLQPGIPEASQDAHVQPPVQLCPVHFLEQLDELVEAAALGEHPNHEASHDLVHLPSGLPVLLVQLHAPVQLPCPVVRQDDGRVTDPVRPDLAPHHLLPDLLGLLRVPQPAVHVEQGVVHEDIGLAPILLHQGQQPHGLRRPPDLAIHGDHVAIGDHTLVETSLDHL